MNSEIGKGFLNSNYKAFMGDQYVPSPAEWQKTEAAVANLRLMLADAIKWCPRCKGRRTWRKNPCADCLKHVQALAVTEPTT